MLIGADGCLWATVLFIWTVLFERLRGAQLGRIGLEFGFMSYPSLHELSKPL